MRIKNFSIRAVLVLVGMLGLIACARPTSTTNATVSTVPPATIATHPRPLPRLEREFHTRLSRLPLSFYSRNSKRRGQQHC